VKKVHPIRKMREAEARCGTIDGRERALARHVRPLLTALDMQHAGNVGYSQYHHEDDCDCCALLAKWRAAR